MYPRVVVSAGPKLVESAVDLSSLARQSPADSLARLDKIILYLGDAERLDSHLVRRRAIFWRYKFALPRQQRLRQRVRTIAPNSSTFLRCGALLGHKI